MLLSAVLIGGLTVACGLWCWALLKRFPSDWEELVGGRDPARMAAIVVIWFLTVPLVWVTVRVLFPIIRGVVETFR